VTGLSNGSLHKIIHGFQTRGFVYSGLLEKCPAISVVDRTVMTEEERGLYFRRRTNAYSFDKGLYGSWNRGGSCWLDDDPEDPDRTNPSYPSNPSKDFPNTSNNLEGFENDAMSPDFQKTGTNTHICVHDPQSFQNSENSQQGLPASSTLSPSLCDPGSLEGPDQKSANNTGDHESTPDNPGKPLQNSWKDREGYPSFLEGMHDIHARDYKPLDVPEGTPCFVCGRYPTWFVEKLTAERKARPQGEKLARRLCRHCYQAAKTRDQEACRMLPGTVEVSRMEPVTVFIGKCSLCELDKAVYRDVSTGVMLCAVCYGREIVREGSNEEIVDCTAGAIGFGRVRATDEGHSSLEVVE
jgi:hypothetical protein